MSHPASGSASPSSRHAAPARRRPARGRRRVPPGRERHRVVLGRGAAPAAQPVARGAPPGGRAGAAACATAGSWPRGSTSGGTLRGPDGLLQVIDQLAGVALPASALETLVLPARLANYSPAWLDELMVSGEVLWAGNGALPGNDGWVSLHLAESRRGHPRRTPSTATRPPSCSASVLGALAGGGAYFFRQLAEAVGQRRTTRSSAPRCGTWSGRASSPTTPSARCARTSAGRSPAARRPATASPRSRSMRYGRPSQSVNAGPPTVAGRWSLLPLAEGDTTMRAKATAELLLERHGVVTRGCGAERGHPSAGSRSSTRC